MKTVRVHAMPKYDAAFFKNCKVSRKVSQELADAEPGKYIMVKDEKTNTIIEIYRAELIPPDNVIDLAKLRQS